MANKSLEIRINSVDDAKAVVQQMITIQKEVVKRGLDSINFLVAREIQNQVNAIIYGVFGRTKTFTSYVSPRENNQFFEFRHLKPVQTLASPALKDRMTVSVTPVGKETNGPIPVKAKNKGGRPPGSKNKPKVEA